MNSENINVNLVIGEHSEKYSSDFGGIIGQISVVNKLKFFIESNTPQTPFPTLLFSGSHGLGKTFVAEKLAKNLNRKFIEVNCGTLSNANDFVSGVLIDRVLGSNPVTLLLDEAHCLSDDIATILLTLIAPKPTNKSVLRFKNVSIEYDMSKINVVFGTTDAHLILKPLINRSTKINFESYSNSDLLDMLKLYCPKIKFDCDLEALANACRGRGRDAYQLAQNIIRYCTVNNTNILDKNGWSYLENIFEICYLGLNRQEVELLQVIKHNQPISCANIAMHLMVNEDNVDGEIEIRCRELGLIRNTTRGRELTEEGEKYIERIKL
jgi:Holliday junction resolvasome RuvABC ATP-dependent DNA helicase subunit